MFGSTATLSPHCELRHLGADLDDRTTELVTQNDRPRSRSLAPEDGAVGPAHAACGDLNDHLIWGALWLRHLYELEYARLRQNCGSHSSASTGSSRFAVRPVVSIPAAAGRSCRRLSTLKVNISPRW